MWAKGKALALAGAIGALTACGGTSVAAVSCSDTRGFIRASEAYLNEDSISVAALEAFLNSNASMEGAQYSVRRNGTDLWLDVILFPGEVTAAAVLRTVWIIGRRVVADFDRLVFAEGDRPLFALSAEALKQQGCQFIWQRDGGQNPVYLLRLFFDALRYYESGARVAARYSGSLLGDQMSALTAHNDIFIPQWVLSAVR